jgi:hypothetical protein
MGIQRETARPSAWVVWEPAERMSQKKKKKKITMKCTKSFVKQDLILYPN